MPFIALSDSGPQTDQPTADEVSTGFIPLASDKQAQGFVPIENSEPPSVLKNVLLNNPLTAIGETAANLGTMAVALPAAGLAGLGTLAGNALGLTDRNPVDVVHGVSEAMTYQPRGDMGKAATGIATYPFEKLAEAGQYAGTKTLDAIGSPIAATVVDTAINALPMAIGPGVKLTRRAINRPRAEAVADPVATERAAVPDTAVAPENMGTSDAAPVQRGFTPVDTATPDATIVPENVVRATEATAPPDITPHLAAGVEELTRIKDSGVSVPDAMAQSGIHSDAFTPESRQLAQFLADNFDNPSKLADFETAYRDTLAAGDKGFTERAAQNENQIGRSTDAGIDTPPDGAVGRESGNAPGSESRNRASGLPDTAAETGQARTDTVRYALVEADELRPSHDVSLRARDAYPDQFKRDDWTRSDAEKRVQGIVNEFDPARLAESVDDGAGAPTMAIDGTVEAGNARAIALQRVYQANGAKAEGYRQFLRDNSDRLGLQPEAVDTMKKPVLVRIPDEPPARPIADSARAGDLPADGKVNAMVPGANYVGFVNDRPLPGAVDTAKPATRPEPIRRENILINFAKALNTGIYEGRVTSKRVMGFFRPKLEEVRIKRHADLETAAHELAHLIDKRVPEIRKTWSQGPDWQIHREELRGLSYDKTKIYEGFAEFVRHYMTQPSIAQTRAPVFYKWFEGFTQRHQYGPAIVEAQKGMESWFNQDAVDRARSKIGKHDPMTDALDGKWDAFRQATVDDLHGVYRMERQLTGNKIAPNGPYESARLSRASASIADGAIRFGAPLKKADGSFGWTGKGLEEIMRPVAENLDDALMYFVGRSARELMAQGREHLFTPGEIDGMLKLKRPEFAKAFDEYQAWNSAVADFAEAHGVINGQSRMMWQRLEYLPFHRVGSP
ncbi:MAG: hypothetical protein ACOYNZ_15690, partial [Rhodoferax sp.]